MGRHLGKLLNIPRTPEPLLDIPAYSVIATADRARLDNMQVVLNDAVYSLAADAKLSGSSPGHL